MACPCMSGTTAWREGQAASSFPTVMRWAAEGMFQKTQELLVLGAVRARSGSARPCLTLLLQQREPGILSSAPRDARFLS